MFKPAWMLLAAAAFAAGCGSDPVVEPSQQGMAPAPVEVTPPPPEPAPSVVEAKTPAPPDEPPAPGDAPATVSKPEQVAGAGKYRVCAVSETTAAAAASWVKKLEAAGLRVETETAEVGGNTWQRVVVPGMRNGREARQMASYLGQALGLKDAWVVPRTEAAPAAPATPAAPAKPAAPAAAPAPPAEVPKPAPAAPATPEPESKAPDAEHPQN